MAKNTADLIQRETLRRIKDSTKRLAELETAEPGSGYVDNSTAQTIAGAKTFTSNLTVDGTGALTGISAITDGQRSYFSVTSYRNSAALGFFQMAGARGTEAVPLVVQNNDKIAQFLAYGWSGAAAAFVVAGTFEFIIDGTPDSGGDTTDMPSRFVISTTPEGSGSPIVGLIVGSEQNVSIAPVKGPADVRLYVLQPVLGSIVQRLASTATNDDPIEDFLQGRIATTDATVTTLHTVTIPASTTVVLEGHVTARRTGGVSGTAEDGAGYGIVATFKNVAGVATQIGATTVLYAHESQAAWDCVFDVTGATARVRVTGAASNNITWHLSALRVRFVSI